MQTNRQLSERTWLIISKLNQISFTIFASLGKITFFFKLGSYLVTYFIAYFNNVSFM